MTTEPEMTSDFWPPDCWRCGKELDPAAHVWPNDEPICDECYEIVISEP